ncbi:hypothetical protein CORC01_06731 [Colletotrichum orchidophilum]|uniref:Uncharacterized protein n=1 Tax=Colletotrichum orchidophilum TaxID=1209926 RepID=A0A1G4B8V2_9PEZI|nr:uncharacterized protein CORC01_06731 [Colletotrichum orchidophilum]OHE97868.1 hypothetical protein CORC01_06731 [Colletotrichum orchidophilum]
MTLAALTSNPLYRMLFKAPQLHGFMKRDQSTARLRPIALWHAAEEDGKQRRADDDAGQKLKPILVCGSASNGAVEEMEKGENLTKTTRHVMISSLISAAYEPHGDNERVPRAERLDADGAVVGHKGRARRLLEEGTHRRRWRQFEADVDIPTTVKDSSMEPQPW